ncbi:MAG: hypothetical protein CM1200mP30_12190 [Pseudomonadota bacterium]|nr:MAG: hypothetical protein CM1200mP30_12190 [Pseudomonadota bacterium]
MILSESKKVIRFKKGLIVVQNHQGVILAKQGLITQMSNRMMKRTRFSYSQKTLTVQQKKFIKFISRTGFNFGVIINDSMGEPGETVP